MSFLTDEIMAGTNWLALERAIARLVSHCGWSSVRWIGGKGDKGGDVVGVRDLGSGKKVFVFQVKAVTGGNFVGPEAIQEAMTAMHAYSGNVAVVATNGDFTQTAYKRAQDLVKDGYEIFLWNGSALRSLLDEWHDHHFEKREPFAFQNDIIQKVFSSYSAGIKSSQFIVATGLGKTVIASTVAAEMRRLGMNRILVLCHSQDLALQLEQSFWNQLDRNTPTRIFFDGRPPSSYEGVSFGLYQTLSGYIPGIDANTFDVIIVDEAHHALSSGFLQCINYFTPKFLLGMTATPWRGDGRSTDEIFGAPVARVSLVDGMLMGHLAEVDYRIMCDNINWDEVSKLSGGRYSIKDLNKRLFIPQRDEAIASEFKAAISDLISPKVIIFCSSIEHCRRFAELFTFETGFVCRSLSGEEKVTRNRYLMEFASGRIQAVTAVDVLNEGIDVPDVNVLIFLRATHSRRIFVQQLGRGLRLPLGRSKKLRVLDFVTDVRRIAEVVDMDNTARAGAKQFNNLALRQGFVKFSDVSAEDFVQQWLRDVSELSAEHDSHILTFPDALR